MYPVDSFNKHPRSPKNFAEQSPAVSREDLQHELLQTDLACLARDEQLLDSLAQYLNTLLQWNKRFNLVGPKSWQAILHNLILDSLYLAYYLPELRLPEQSLTLDFGAGAGLPGLPLRICSCKGTYIMLEPRQKRAAFLQHMIVSLQLEQTVVRNQRVQDLHPEKFKADLILSRGFCVWPDFLQTSVPFIRPDGYVLTFSSRPWQDKDQAPAPWSFNRQWTYSLSSGVQRYFWLFSPNRDCS